MYNGGNISLNNGNTSEFHFMFKAYLYCIKMQQILNFSEFNELIKIYDELKKEINNLNALNPSIQSIMKIKTLTIDLDNKIQQLKTMVVITALMYTGKIKNCLKYKNYKK